MKFTDKYELLESLTTGTVETFVANDKVRCERVLVHIVESAPQKPGQTTTEWVLDSFRRVAPEPSGPVLETGKYGETKYVYLVTKPADDAAQKSWVRRYEIQGQDTRETTTRPMPVETSPPPVAEPTVTEPTRSPVSVTQLLRDFDSQMKPPAKPKEPIAAPLPLPNLTLGGNQSGLHSAPPWEPVRPVPTPPKNEEPRISLPAESFARESKDAGFPSATFPVASTTGNKESSKPGEFTSFFQGPFRGDSSSDMPSLSAQPIEPPRKTVGEFTAIFGSVGPKPEPGVSPLEESGNIPAPPSTFTGIFKDMEGAPRSGNPSAPRSAVTPTPLDPLPAANEPTPTPVYAPPPPAAPLKPVLLPPLPVPGIEKPVVRRPGSFPGDGATGAFSRPVASEPAPVMPATPAGPSPYTQIISREKLMAESGDVGEEGAPSPAGAGKFAAPAMPKAPALTPPKVPQVKMPPPPKIAAPKAPKLSKVDAPAPPSVSILPVVLTLTGLFFLAVLLVLYFVLKH